MEKEKSFQDSLDELRQDIHLSAWLNEQKAKQYAMNPKIYEYEIEENKKAKRRLDENLELIRRLDNINAINFRYNKDFDTWDFVGCTGISDTAREYQEIADSFEAKRNSLQWLDNGNIDRLKKLAGLIRDGSREEIKELWDKEFCRVKHKYIERGA